METAGSRRGQARLQASQVEALLFDLDGTLVDTRQDIFESLNYALAALGRPRRTLDEVTRFIGDGARELLKRALGEENRALSEALEIFRSHYLAHCVDHARLYPGVRDILDRFSHKALAVVTNKLEAHTRAVLEALQVADRFQAVLCADLALPRKPAPDLLLEGARRLNVAPGRAMMVGDSPMDVEAGRRAGMRTCAVTYGYRPEEELRAAGPDLVVSRMADLASLLSDDSQEERK
jgi:phosphoglycolate phosphatase